MATMMCVAFNFQSFNFQSMNDFMGSHVRKATIFADELHSSVFTAKVKEQEVGGAAL